MRKTGKPSAGTVGSPNEVCKIMRKTLLAADREKIMTVHLDIRNNIIGIEEVAKGVLSGVETTPREVFKGAILNNAASLILVHNHPSGYSSPSQADVNITRNMVQIGKVLGIPVLDHIIVAEDGCYAMRNASPSVFEGALLGGSGYDASKAKPVKPMRKRKR